MRNVSIATAIGMFALANAAAATEVSTSSTGASTGSTTSSTSNVAPASQSSSMRAYVDSDGKLRQATAEERAAEAREDSANARARAAKGHGVIYKTLPSGARRALDTDGQLMESVLVTRNPDGSLAYSYASGNGQVVEAAVPRAEEK